MSLTVFSSDLPRNIFQKVFKITPKIKPLIAKKDIICYKRMYPTDLPSIWKSEYFGDFYMENIKRPEIKLVPIKVEFWIDECIKIEEGYHSYINKDNIVPPNELEWVECIIPKGSIYYIGDFNNCRDSYVSNIIIVKGINIK